MRNVGATVGCSLVLASGLAVAQQHTMPSGKVTDDELIKSAMSAAPEAIGKDATIIDVGSDGKIRVVRQGSNQFTCMADNPNTPGADPMCADRNAMEWVDAQQQQMQPRKKNEVLLWPSRRSGGVADIIRNENGAMSFTWNSAPFQRIANGQWCIPASAGGNPYCHVASHLGSRDGSAAAANGVRTAGQGSRARERMRVFR